MGPAPVNARWRQLALAAHHGGRLASNLGQTEAARHFRHHQSSRLALAAGLYWPRGVISCFRWIQ